MEVTERHPKALHFVYIPCQNDFDFLKSQNLVFLTLVQVITDDVHEVGIESQPRLKKLKQPQITNFFPKQ